jgi:hypothetical protein
MKAPRDLTTARLAQGQAGIMDVLATGAVFSGTLHGLSRAFRLSTDDFRACLRELVEAGQLVVVMQPDARLTIRLERRSRAERRQPVTGAWSL